jgi:hypothetical protein
VLTLATATIAAAVTTGTALVEQAAGCQIQTVQTAMQLMLMQQARHLWHNSNSNSLEKLQLLCDPMQRMHILIAIREGEMRGLRRDRPSRSSSVAGRSTATLRKKSVTVIVMCVTVGSEAVVIDSSVCVCCRTQSHSTQRVAILW